MLLVLLKGGSKRDCHVNLLKRYHGRSSREQVAGRAVAPVERVNCGVAESVVTEDADVGGTEPIGVRLKNSDALRLVEEQLQHLPSVWQSEVKVLIFEFPTLFSDAPGSLVVYEVDMGSASPIKQHPYSAS